MHPPTGTVHRGLMPAPTTIGMSWQDEARHPTVSMSRRSAHWYNPQRSGDHAVEIISDGPGSTQFVRSCMVDLDSTRCRVTLRYVTFSAQTGLGVEPTWRQHAAHGANP